MSLVYIVSLTVQRLLDKITRGALLHMDNVPMQTTVEDVRKVFEGIKVMWVDREKDSTEVSRKDCCVC